MKLATNRLRLYINCIRVYINLANTTRPIRISIDREFCLIRYLTTFEAWSKT